MKYIKYSHKLFFIAILFSIGIYFPYATQTWVAYIVGIIAGYLFAQSYKTQFEKAVLSLGWVNDSGLNPTLKKKINVNYYSPLAGVIGIFVYLLIKNFIGGNIKDMIGSFCFGGIIGIFYYYAFLARRLEKSNKNSLSDLKNKPLEKNQEDTKINPIGLSEAELVASITYITGDIKNIPLDKVAENFVGYNLGKEFIKRFGLKDVYEFEVILHGLKSLEKRGLIVEKDKQMEIDDLFACLLGVVSSGIQMSDGTFYDKDTHISSNYHKNENGDYIFTLVSKDIRSIPRSFPKFIVLALLLVGLVSVGIYFGKYDQKDTYQTTPTPSEINLTALGENKLSYVKNGDIFFADKNGVEQITSGHKVSNLKVSHDGKYLGWIEKKDFTIEDRTTRSAGYAISLINLATLETIYDAIGPLSFVSNDDIHRKEIISFDFLNTNPLTFVYTSDGVWRKEFSTNKKEKLLNNDYGKNNYIEDDQRYSKIITNPQADKLLLEIIQPNSCGIEIFELKTRSIVTYDNLRRFCHGIWRGDGKTIFAYKDFNVNKVELIYSEINSDPYILDFSYPIDNPIINYGIAVLNDNNLVAVLHDRSKKHIGLYYISLYKETVARLITDHKVVIDKPPVTINDNQVGYLISSNEHGRYDLNTIYPNGQNNQTIVKGISEYVWIPKEIVTSDNSSNVDFSFPKSGYEVSMNFADNKNVNLSYAFSKKNCVNKYANEKEMTSKTIYNGCWDYTEDTDIYYANGPSTRFELKIISNADLSELLKPVASKYNAESQTTTSQTTIKDVHKIGEKDFITITRESSYEYFDKETNKIIKGQASKYIQCLYPLSNNNYLYYGTVFASAGSIEDNCQKFADLKLTNITYGQNKVNNKSKLITSPSIYISNNLGIKFSYSEKPPTNKNGIKVEEIGNKIYLYGVGEKLESGQFVEVFKKEENIDFESSVRKQILNGYSSEDCKLQIKNGKEFSANYQQEYKVITLNYADKLMDANQSIGDNQDKCPVPYVSYGGRAFFLYNEKHPEKFLFFSIGQYGIEAEIGKMWEETIEFID